MEQIKVTISTNTPISIRVIQQPKKGLAKLLCDVKKRESATDEDKKR